ncbi:6,7-dimethyl-8-ribityllumazine synthase [Senna tora]|uniref:6,7-dimethyl-8-ribityllumazine synthase n=1 Tax=Senna tora TaxID=362788 RepID=A0A834U4Y2_9FABA|nr:6,7-dimethyl-8-ribityllumazine synthase [Senna tora]
MPLSLLQISSSSPFHSTLHNPSPISLLPKTLFPDFHLEPRTLKPWIFSTTTSRRTRTKTAPRTATTHASLLETPVLWAGRLCIFYALLKAGLAGSQANPLVSDLEIGGSDESGDLGFSKWTQSILGKPAKEAANGRKLVSKWHPTTKGTLRRNYRVPSKSEGRRLLKAVAALLSDDDHFVDATSHKGCQIRRESAHGESVCCNNVRALFDELPTPHLIVEITPFPSGSLTEKDYTKAEKLEKVLRSSPSV